MIPDLSQQLSGIIKTTRRLKYSVVEEKEQRVLELYEWLQDQGLNVTVKSVAEARKIKPPSAREYLYELVEQRKLISWKIGATVWFGVRQ